MEAGSPAPAGSGAQPWHAVPSPSVVAALGTNDARGLETDDAAARLERDGPNSIAAGRHERWWDEVLESLREPLQLLLLAVGAAYLLLGEVADALTILAVVGIVSGIEVLNQLRARRAVASLATIGAPTAMVIRGGELAEIAASGLVTGDLVLLEPGRRVPADMRLTASAGLRIDESSLTGESQPVAKDADARLEPIAELGDRRTMAYTATLVTAGNGRGVVVATGPATELGRIAGLVAESHEPPTPLQRAMRELSRWLLVVALGFSVLVPAVGILVARRPPQEMLLTGLTLAFATIPEELPILITIVLGIGAHRLARRNAIVKRLRAAETLGSVSVVATDKTGTLTENRMRVVELFANGRHLHTADFAAEPIVARLLAAGALANDAQVAGPAGRLEFAGDPTDAAFLVAATELGIDVAALRRAAPELAALPLDDVRRRMSVVSLRGGHRTVATKGAPESVLGVCSWVSNGEHRQPLDGAGRGRLLAEADAMAAAGLRVLAVAERQLEPEIPAESGDLVEQHLTLLGFAGLEDPLRSEASEAVRALRDAGIAVYVLTGDHPATATSIAARVGIHPSAAIRGAEVDRATSDGLAGLLRRARVFARITPEHKLRIVRALQESGEVVAVTGDGVNDAPALREAAIGVAMGRAGTDVAREAADLVLADDNLATVTAAVEAGRSLFANLRKAVRFYLAAKVALVSASLVAVLLRLPVPFDPVQIILMELFMDVGASVTFVSEPPEEDVMHRPPRDPRRPFLDRSMRFGIIGGGLSLAAAVLVPYLWSWIQGADQTTAQTAAFAAWMIGNVVLAAHMRTERTPLLPNGLLSNRAFVAWALATALTVATGLAVPAFAQRLHLAPLADTTWIVTLAAALLIPSWWEAWKRIRPRQAAARPASAGGRSPRRPDPSDSHGHRRPR